MYNLNIDEHTFGSKLLPRSFADKPSISHFDEKIHDKKRIILDEKKNQMLQLQFGKRKRIVKKIFLKNSFKKDKEECNCR